MPRLLLLPLLLPVASFAGPGNPAETAQLPAFRDGSAAEATVLPDMLVHGSAPLAPSPAGNTSTITAAQIDVSGQGLAAPFTRALLAVPGVSQDSGGLVHFREEDPYYQYYLNGIPLPSGISGFGQDLDTLDVKSVTTAVGALPAQYAWGSYGIVDVQTRAGATPPTLTVSSYGGSYDTVHPSVAYSGASGPTDLFVSASYLHDDLGIENPAPSSTPLHDLTDQYKAFASLSRSLTGDRRFSAILGGSWSSFEIPDLPGQVSAIEFRGRARAVPVAASATLNETQTEQSDYAIEAYQASGGETTWALSNATRFSAVIFRPDAPGDLYFQGVASRVARGILSDEIRADASHRWAEHHTLRAGARLAVSYTRTGEGVGVFAADDDDRDPVTGQTIVTSVPPFRITDRHDKYGVDTGLYAEDEWAAAPRLALNLGLRLDTTHAYVTASQLSPRLIATYQLAPGTVLHAGYARYFIPPPLESVSPASVSKFDGTTNAAGIETDDPVKPERSDYLDAGLTQDFGGGWEGGLDAYDKRARDQIDDGQFGAANIYSPYNFGRAHIYGLEASLRFARGGLSAYGSFAAAQSWAQGIVSSEFEFDPDELAAVNAHAIHPDQTQFYTASAGLSYSWRRLNVHADAIYGSGIRSGFANRDSLPANYPVDLGAAYHWARISVRLDLINAFDQVYLLDDGTGVGVGAPRYGRRRGVYAGVSRVF
ncbi:MAG TPA: TonB-dependent receptor [Opitutaceae bacterium]|nr:TonB-dependent receptor [Opitutaceae bacterium]